MKLRTDLRTFLTISTIHQPCIPRIPIETWKCCEIHSDWLCGEGQSIGSQKTFEQQQSISFLNGFLGIRFASVTFYSVQLFFLSAFSLLWSSRTFPLRQLSLYKMYIHRVMDDIIHFVYVFVCCWMFVPPLLFVDNFTASYMSCGYVKPLCFCECLTKMEGKNTNWSNFCAHRSKIRW